MKYNEWVAQVRVTFYEIMKFNGQFPDQFRNYVETNSVEKFEDLPELTTMSEKSFREWAQNFPLSFEYWRDRLWFFAEYC